ncbi:DNA repair protein RAD51 homolog 2-like [Callithrix jacchus]|uniref:DNA repair protein RAD51 homolog 2-like n=1 Tax=Callithrix jacchus TaxID=9483 RepID=UPI0023DD61DF|nr:DNA repair protein RAD51 homolog 2-like [Callithrix jacchus]
MYTGSLPSIDVHWLFAQHSTRTQLGVAVPVTYTAFKVYLEPQNTLACSELKFQLLRMDLAYGIKAQRSADFSPAFFSTTLSALDEALHAGVACGSLTEITGPPGCGKTQFCIMMSILATLSTNMGGLEGAVVYIDTESAFSAERLVEIAESHFPRYFNTEEKLVLASSKVHLYQELTYDEVLQRIESLEEEIISKGIKLVIIDSLASVVNKEFDTQLPGNLKERNKFLAREASSLKYLAEEFSVPAV